MYLNSCRCNPGSRYNQPLSCIVQAWQQALAQHTAPNTRFCFVSHNHHALLIPELTVHEAGCVLSYEGVCNHNRGSSCLSQHALQCSRQGRTAGRGQPHDATSMAQHNMKSTAQRVNTAQHSTAHHITAQLARHNIAQLALHSKV